MSAQDVWLDFKSLRSMLNRAPLSGADRAAIYDSLRRIESSYRALENDRNEWRSACARLGMRLSCEPCAATVEGG